VCRSHHFTLTSATLSAAVDPLNFPWFRFPFFRAISASRYPQNRSPYNGTASLCSILDTSYPQLNFPAHIIAISRASSSCVTSFALLFSRSRDIIHLTGALLQSQTGGFIILPNNMFKHKHGKASRHVDFPCIIIGSFFVFLFLVYIERILNFIFGYPTY
jgi:hypothetical protein